MAKFCVKCGVPLSAEPICVACGANTKLGGTRGASVTATTGAKAAAPNRCPAPRSNQEWVYLAGIKALIRAAGRGEEK